MTDCYFKTISTELLGDELMVIGTTKGNAFVASYIVLLKIMMV